MRNDSDASEKSKKITLHDFSLRQHDIRALICMTAAGTALTHVHWPNLNLSLIFLGAVIIVYGIGSYLFIKRSTAKQDRIYDRFLTVDAAFVGVLINLIDFNVLPTILFFTMLQFNSLMNGGLKKWAIDNVGLIVGLALSFLVKTPDFSHAGPLEISNFSLIGIFAYFCAYALYAHRRMKKLDAHIKRLSNEHTLYKLQSYKMSRYLTPTVWKAISDGREKSLSTQRKRVTFFFSDIQGFSTLSEELEAETLTELLNSYLTEMARIAAKHKGTIDKFMGDGIMVLFGDAGSDGMKMDALRSVSMAIEMRKKMKELQMRWYNQGIKKPMLIRMGINTGYCTVGSFGTSHYMDYTVLGTQVNIAQRLESAAEPGEILITHETWSLVKDVVMCRDQGEISVKGSSHPVRIYQVVDFRKDLGKGQTWFEENTNGFSMHMDLEKIRNYDRNKIIEILDGAIQRVKDQEYKNK